MTPKFRRNGDVARKNRARRSKHDANRKRPTVRKCANA